ncbi:MAG: efflux RND transporter periplasmic adaptor subunit [candidate division Zixibacteria bacterium]|nr:efflux RND transporter periplasmic adaptor subunit [candidate division Zixibacteria bacterium]
MKKRLWIAGILLVIISVAITSVTLLGDSETDKDETATLSISPQSSNKAVVVDWCAEHSVPESECTQCDPSLIDKYKAANDWCAGHALPESHCRLCNPEITFPQEELLASANAGHNGIASPEKAQNNVDLDWCAEHSVPESQCTQCNSSLIEQYKIAHDWCAPHALPESHCRLCNPEIAFPQEETIRLRLAESPENEIKVTLFFRPNADVCATNGALIQFVSSRTAERSGIAVRRALAAPYESSIDAPAEIMFDENSTSVIASAVKVLVSRWLISPGDIVAKGDPIAMLQSSEMAELQARLISTHAEFMVQQKELERDEALVSKKLVSESEYERRVALHKKAQAELTSVRGLLLSSGISDADIDDLLDKGTVTNEFVFRAPNSGLIAKRLAQVGELLEDGQALAIQTDPASLWIEAHLTEDQMKHVFLGQDLLFASDDRALNRVGAKVIWVSPYLDSHTRTGVVRAQVVENGHYLRAGEFGRVTISEALDIESVLVPKDAVQWEGCCNVVFVREAIDRFRPRKVQIADGPGSYYQITEGLLPGEEVVVEGSFLLKTELKKTSIGAGCCGIEPVG